MTTCVCLAGVEQPIFSVSYSHTMFQHFLWRYEIICPHIPSAFAPSLVFLSLTCGTNISVYEVNLSPPGFQSIYCKWVLWRLKLNIMQNSENIQIVICLNTVQQCFAFKLFPAIK